MEEEEIDRWTEVRHKERVKRGVDSKDRLAAQLSIKMKRKKTCRIIE